MWRSASTTGEPSHHRRELTSDFTYVRFHGTNGHYSGSYTEEMLRTWADQICEWIPRLGSIYVYFNNHLRGHAVKNAQALERLLRKNHRR
jgi:uncharacterized protein YecE (DUF72 family)